LLSASAELPANIDSVSGAVGALATQAGAGYDQVALLKDALNELNGTTSGASIELFFRTIGAADSRAAFEQNIGGVQSGGAQSGGGNTTNITIENNVSQVDSTSSARTAQSINSLVNSPE
jgi:hypothetical protein